MMRISVERKFDWVRSRCEDFPPLGTGGANRDYSYLRLPPNNNALFLSFHWLVSLAFVFLGSSSM
jgi:hypothetical protein